MSAMAAARAVFDQEYKPSLAKAAKKQKTVIAGGIGTLALDELWKKHKSEYCKGFEAKMAAAAAKDIYIAEASASAAQADSSVLETGGGTEYALGALFDALSDKAKAPYLAHGREQVRVDLNDDAFKMFTKEYRKSIENVPVGVMRKAGGEDNVLQELWAQQALAVKV